MRVNWYFLQLSRLLCFIYVVVVDDDEQSYPSYIIIIEKAKDVIHRKRVIWKNQNKWCCCQEMAFTQAFIALWWKANRF